MSTSEIKYALKEEWIEATDGANAKAIASQKNGANILNSTQFVSAKAFCLYIKNDTNNHFEWRVRVQTLHFRQKKAQGWTILNLLNLQGTESSSDEEALYSIHQEFLPLLIAIRSVIASIENHKNQLIEPERIHHKLQKLVIYLAQAKEWPYQKEINSIDKVTKLFTEYKKKIEEKHWLEQNQTDFQRSVSDLKKHIHNKFIPLEEITYKIASKTQKTPTGGEEYAERIQKLVKQGTERIYFNPTTTEENIDLFCRVFALHAFVYKKDANTTQTRTDLQNSIKRLVELTAEYDHKNGTWTLLNFFKGLLEEINKCYEKKATSGFHHKNFSSLVWTFEALVKNPEFLVYMQKSGCRDDKLVSLLSSLFLEDKTWEPVANFISFLGDKKLFDLVLGKRLNVSSKQYHLNLTQINHIFHNINLKLDKNPKYKEIALELFFKLMQLEKLHFLIPYAQEPTHSPLLKTNFKKLDFSFMEGALPVEYFFGNATYTILKDNEYVSETDLKSHIVKLFCRQRENPVGNKVEFDNIFFKLLDDFNSGFEALWKEIIPKIGESAAPSVEKDGTLKPVDKWLLDAICVYQALKTYVLKSLPLNWTEEKLKGKTDPIDRLVWYNDQLYLIKKNNEDTLQLLNLHTNDPVDTMPSEVQATHLISEIKALLEELLTHQENRDAVSRLTENYMSFHNNKNVQGEIDKLIPSIFNKMKEEGASGSFNERLIILANFLLAISPFFKKLEEVVVARFFVKEILKKTAAQDLIKIHSKEATSLNFDTPDSINKDDHIVLELSRLISKICMEQVEMVLSHCTLRQLTSATAQLEYVIFRKVDDLSYPKSEFIQKFCSYPNNKSQVAEGTLERVIGTLSIKDDVINNYGEFLRSKDREVPIYFILPNQALAMQLCLDKEFENKNLLLKMGTGQGKSLVIALAAINEAKKIKGGRVFVFTSYDHLAKRDHALGKKMFEKEGMPSVCISTIKNLEDFTQETKIIYADIENIENIIREVMLELLRGKATQNQKLFLNTIYGNSSEPIRIILDEYDLLLRDLEQKEPFVTKIPNDLLDIPFVRNNSVYYPDLPGFTRNYSPNTTKVTDPSTGKSFSLVQPFQGASGDFSGFNLFVSVMRLRKLIDRAERVIGLSGTALKEEPHNLNNVHFFEIPSSQNPDVFGTKIQEEPGTAMSEGISCVQKKKIPLDRGQPLDALKIKTYCKAIVDEIIEVRKAKQKEDITYQRPIMIFADPDKTYAVHSSNTRVNLWDALKDAILNEHLPLIELKEDVLDADLQQIARSGAITLTTIKYGRGADVRVSFDIDEGLHVIVATSVIHRRLLEQLIGRTGRMGRKGSYSAITIGELEENPGQNGLQDAEFFAAMHEITRMFVKNVTNGVFNQENCKKWIMMLSHSKREKKFIKNHVTQLCGTAFEENGNMNKFYV